MWPEVNLTSFWLKNIMILASWELFWREKFEFCELNPTHHGVFETSPVTGGTKRPPYFFRKLYIVWSFAGYIHVYIHKTSFHDNFQTSTNLEIGHFGAFLAKNSCLRPILREKFLNKPIFMVGSTGSVPNAMKKNFVVKKFEF